MAGALSGRLVDSYMSNRSYMSPISSHGAISFNPQMHGTPYTQRPFSLFSESSFCNDDMSEATALKIASLQAKLNQKLGPEYISQRPGPGGGSKLTYAEGWKIINLANEVFGFNGWSSNVVNLTVDFIDYNEESKRYNIGVTAIMRVTLRDGVYHEDIGYGMLENSKSKAAGIDKCKKEAVTDGLKRSLRNFGNLMGNCLYDKSYTQEVVKIKIPPAKFDQSELHRRPEFEETKPIIPLSGPSNLPNSSIVTTPNRLPPAQSIQPKPVQPVAQHVRFERSSSNTTSINHQSTKYAGSFANAPQPQNVSSSAPIQAQQHPNQDSKETPLPIKDDADDSFQFDMDDDALFAALDMTEAETSHRVDDHEADFGPPIDNEQDLGRPIDFEEGRTHNSLVEDKTSDYNAIASHSRMQQRQPDKKGTAIKNEANLQTGTGHGQRLKLIAEGINSVASTSPGPSKALPQTERTHAQSSAQAWSKPPVPLMTGPQHKRIPRQDENHIPETTNQSSTSRTAAVPSVGGFHFPPGVNLIQKGHSVVPLSSVIGIKRSADEISSASNFRGARPGMGLQQSSKNVALAPAKREIFGNLEVGDGGTVKRVRW